MTHQEFNHIFYRYTKSKRGIKPTDKLTVTGYELKEFVDFAVEHFIKERQLNQVEVYS